MEKHYIVGTAGHIDHGKTALSKVLTGKNTDRLKEEKKRNISIELGFAPFELPNGDYVSLVDVPGHERFIKQMIAGASGIDLFLLVIAADEGVMPQTVEHLQILDLLEVKQGIIVITKKDLVNKEFLAKKINEIKKMIAKTTLRSAQIISVSSLTLEGIHNLKQIIQNELTKLPERSSSGFFRMPIDRVFTLKGIGTILTGTVYSGKINIGEKVQLMPSEKTVQIRSLQVHSNSVKEVFAGQRVALNVTGINYDEIERGNSIVTPNYWTTSNRIDVRINFLDGLDLIIKQNYQVKVLIGTSEILGDLIFYDRKEINSGDTVYGQIKLDSPIICSKDDKFILRRPSPAQTIGGGIVINPNANKHKFNPESAKQIEFKSNETLGNTILNLLINKKEIFFTINEIVNDLITPESEVEKELIELLHNNKIIKFFEGNQRIFSSKQEFDALIKNITDHLTQYHEKFPLRLGQQKAEFNLLFFPNIKNKISREILLFLETNKIIKMKDEFISLADFNPHLSIHLKEKVDKIEKKLLEQDLTPNNWDDLIDNYSINEDESKELSIYLLEQNKIVKLTEKIMLHKNNYEKLINLVVEYLKKEETLTIQQAKELLQVSRKYLIPLMELLDREKITFFNRENNYRTLYDATKL